MSGFEDLVAPAKYIFESNANTASVQATAMRCRDEDLSSAQVTGWRWSRLAQSLHRTVRCLGRRSGAVSRHRIVGAGRASGVERLSRSETIDVGLKRGYLGVLHRQDLACVKKGPLIVFETLVGAVHLHLLRRFCFLQLFLQVLDGLLVVIALLRTNAND